MQAWRLRGALMAALWIGTVACGSAAVAQAPINKPINKMCPVLTTEEADPTITLQYHGKTVAFCCDKCQAKFKADPQRYAANLAGLHDETTVDGARDARAESATHAHIEHDGESSDAKSPFLARIHPVIVHFPLAGTLIAMVALLAWLFSKRKLFAFADVPPLLLAAGSSVVAVITGNIAHDSMRFSAHLHEYVEWHEVTATTLMITLLVLSALRLWRWRRLDGKWLVAYVLGLVAASLLVGVVGFLGGSIVFGPDHLLP